MAPKLLVVPGVKSPPAERGFTLVETLLAVAFAASVFTTAAYVFLASGRAVAASTLATHAALLATEKLERLRALSLDDPVMAPAVVDTLQQDLDGYYDAPRPGYRRRWGVTPLPMHPSSCAIIEVHVLHEAGDIVARVVTIRCRKAS